MLKSALTLWYTLAVLIGPGVCCCSWASPKAQAQQPAPKPAKSCCSTPTEPTCAEHPRGDPAKCPCKQHKKVAESNIGAVAPDTTGQLRAADWVVASVSFDVTVSALHSLPVGSLDAPRPLGGRTLLAAYHILRC